MSEPEPETVIILTVPEDRQGVRLDQFLQETGRFPSRHQIKQLIESRSIRVSGAGVKPSYRVKAGEQIRADIPPPVAAESIAQAIDLDIVYEDPALLVVNKPAGMVVHPAAGHDRDTLVNALLHHCRDLSGIGGTLRPGIVHRLDKDTSGLLVVAKGDAAHVALSAQFQDHSIHRQYIGLVLGALPENRGAIDAAIGRHPRDRKKMSTKSHQGRDATTFWQVERRYHGCTLARFRLKTGRTHQIRVHLSEMGYPIAGDPIYGGKKGGPERQALTGQELAAFSNMNRLFLHAEALGFKHPEDGRELKFSCELPPELVAVQDLLRPQAEG